MATSAAPGRGSSPARLAPGATVGGAKVVTPLRVTPMAEVYQVETANGAATLHVVHPALAKLPAVKDAVRAASERSAGLPAHKHLARTLGAGVDPAAGLWVLTDPLDGSTVRELLAIKRESSGGKPAGFGVKGVGNLLVGVADALSAGMVHGALSVDSVIVGRTGRIRIVDLPLGSALAAAIAAGAVPAGSWLAPEVARGAAPSAEADVYGLGALLYETLVGAPLQRGGPRPSDVVPGLTTTVDELIARACAASPQARFGSATVMRELIAEALHLDGEGEEAAPAAAAPAGTPAVAPAAAPALTIAPRPGVTDNPAFVAALADPTERFLVTRGKFDYGPFSLADILAQIDRHEIVAGNILIDKDTGARLAIETHPLLGPLVDRAKQVHDDTRRANAEVAHQSKEKKRSVLLFVGIGAVLAGLAVVAYVLFGGGRKKVEQQVAGVANVGGATLEVKLSEPKKWTRPAKPGGGKPGGGRPGGGKPGGGGDDEADEMLALDLSGEDDEGTETLDMTTIFNVYSKYGNELGGCVRRAGESYVLISIIIDGPSGRVTWVRVNQQKGGPAYDCIKGVLGKMRFPAVNGPRSRAEFDIAL